MSQSTPDLRCPAPSEKDPWVEAAESTLAAKVAQVRELRQVGGLPSPAEGPSGVLHKLSDVRTRLDQVDSVLSEVAEFRTRVRVVHKESLARVEDKWNEAIVGTNRVKRTQFGEFGGEAPRERYAKADTAVLGHRVVERQRERALNAVNDAYNAIDLVRRGLESFRLDLHAMLRVVSAPEHRLDRIEVE